MTRSWGRFGGLVGWYYLAVGVALSVLGWRTTSWWNDAVSLAFLIIGVATLSSAGEWTTLFRGEIDERRKRAQDHGFKVGFFVLAWWIGAVALYAGNHAVSTGVWAAGNALALAAVVVDYALVLRRT